MLKTKNFKELFFTSDETQVNTSFPPDKNPSVNDAVIPAQNIQDTLRLYEQEFDKLNLEGPDFFEFLRAISKIPEDFQDARTYQVIQATLDLDKKTLLENAKFYVDKLREICVARQDSLMQGIQTIRNTQKEETAVSSDKLNELNKQIQELQLQRDMIAATIKSINDKHSANEQELNNQMKANDLAISTIVGRINNVVEGIKSNIK